MAEWDSTDLLSPSMPPGRSVVDSEAVLNDHVCIESSSPPGPKCVAKRFRKRDQQTSRDDSLHRASPTSEELLHSAEVLPTAEFASSEVHVDNTFEPEEHFSPALDQFSASVVALDQGESPAASGVSSFQDSWHLVRGGDPESLAEFDAAPYSICSWMFNRAKLLSLHSPKSALLDQLSDQATPTLVSIAVQHRISCELCVAVHLRLSYLMDLWSLRSLRGDSSDVTCHTPLRGWTTL